MHKPQEDRSDNQELLSILENWAAGGKDQLVPELLVAATDYTGVIEDALIERMLGRLYEVEGKPRIWLQFAHAILPVHKKADNDGIKLKFLSYIYEHNEKICICWQTNCNPVIKGAGNAFRAELPAQIEALRQKIEQKQN